MPSLIKTLAFLSLLSLTLAYPEPAKTTTSTSTSVSSHTTKTTATTTKTKTKTKTKKPKTTSTSSSSSSCSPFTTTTANFDALPTNSAPPNSYGTFSWSSFTVTDPSNYQINTTSPPNGVVIPPFQSFLTNSGGYYWATLTGFNFACSSYIQQFNAYLPEPCSLMIYSSLDLDPGNNQINAYGPFNYGGCDFQNYDYTCNMTHVDLSSQNPDFGGIIGYEFYYVVSSGPATVQVLFDDVTALAENPACPPM